MRVKTQIHLFISIALLIVLAMSIIYWLNQAKLDDIAVVEERSQAAASKIASLQSLTHEYFIHSEERVATQWLSQQTALVDLLQERASSHLSIAPVTLIKVSELADLFQRLKVASSNDSSFKIRQKNFLAQQLLISTEVVSDAIKEWESKVRKARISLEREFRLLTLVIPILMLVILLLLGFLLNHRVLLPLKGINNAVGTASKGDLSVRSNYSGNDELGDLSMSFNLMAENLSKTMATKDEYFEEIKQRKRAEEKLRESEHKFRSLFDQAAETILLLKPSPGGPPIIADVNPSGAKLHGYTPSELIGRPLTIIDPFVSPEEVASRIERLESGEIAQFQVQHLQKNGEHLWLDVSLKLIETDSERFYLSTERDITALKKAEEEQQRLSDRLLLATASAQLGVWDWNVRENTMVWDDRMFELYGVTREETPNNVEAWTNGLHPEDKEAAIAACQAALNGAKSFDTEFRVLHPDETVKHLKANGLVIMGSDGKPDRMIGVNTDITEKKKLQEAQLRSSQLAALGEVAAGVAHEINNPINGVINYAQLLINKNGENDSSNQILERIMKEGNRISSIVHNLLNFAQKDRGEYSSLNLMDIIVEPLNLNAQFFKKDGIHIDVGIPDDLPEIYGNRMQLEQVILNLLSNARHALNKRFPEPSNEKFIVIDATTSSNQNGGTVQLRIKDSGCGIPKENLEKVFNPFFTTKEAGVGTGLGMSVSHDILENHGATISIYSQVNKFTQVIITFPVKSEEIRS